MRGLSKRFLAKMRDKLVQGYLKGYRGWDARWVGVYFPCEPLVYFISRLHQEFDELIVALSRKDTEQVREEAADMANFLMFIADYVEEASEGEKSDHG